jgi:5'-nucleotidase
MNILLTNDDGYQAEGLRILYKIFHLEHDVTVIAPDNQRSAASHAITLNEPIKVSPLSQFKGYAVRGTPTDCVKLALLELMPTKPDLVLSGINHGGNTGNNAIYSGTLAAASDAAMFGIPAIAVSLEVTKDRELFLNTAAKFISYLIDVYPSLRIPPGVFLSVNVPNLPLDKIKGFKLARQAPARPVEYYDKYKDNQGNSYYWLAINTPPLQTDDQDGDITVVAQGYIAITPMGHDLTNLTELARLDTYMRHLPIFQD